MTYKLTVSVVIPAYSMERWDTILEAISSLQIQTIVPNEIIVAIGLNQILASSLEQKFGKQIKIVIDPIGRGPSRTRNIGAKIATSDIIAFLEDDAKAEPDWVQNILKNYEDNNVMAVGGKVSPILSRKIPFWFPYELLWVVGCTYEGHPNIRTAIRSLPGCNMSFRQQVFRTIGYFNLNFGRPGNLIGAEDTEMFVRLHKRIPESIIVFDPSIIVHHNVTNNRMSIKYTIRRSFGEGLGRAFLRTTYPGALSSEANLLHYIIKHSFPQRFKNIIHWKNPLKNISQIGVLFLSVTVTGIGFVLGTSSSIMPKYQKER
jgi:glycosyltransferase involved in cell wall biosynthesis